MTGENESLGTMKMRFNPLWEAYPPKLNMGVIRA